MAAEILSKSDTAITWAEADGDYDMTIDLLATLAAGQGAKGDLGATRAPSYSVELMIDTGGTAPTTGETVDLYWAPSNSATAGTSNPGGTSGTDAAYTGIGSATVAESVVELQSIGSLTCVDETHTNLRQYFTFTPQARFGMPVVVNSTSQTLGVGSTITLTPIIPIVQ